MGITMNPQTPAIRNNNPGNLKDPKTGAFRQFKTPQEGYAGLLNDLQAKKTGTTTTGLGPSSTLIDFASVYAPSTDKNNPGQYAANLANQMGVRPDSKLGELDIAKWAAAVAKNEDQNSVFAEQKIIPNTVQNKASTTPAPKQEEGFLRQVSGDITKAATGVGSAVSRAAQGDINPLSGVLQAGGAAARGVTDVTSTAIENIPVVGKVVKGIEGLIGKGAEKVAETKLGQKAIGSYQNFAEKHPEAAGNIGAVGNIATAVPVLKGLSAVKRGVGSATSKALYGSSDDVAKAVAPKLSAKETAQAITQRGTEKKGLLRQTTVKPDPRVIEIADVVRANVPKFNPSKSALYNIDETQKVVSDMARKLKQEVIAGGQNRIYNYRELAARLNKIDRPLLIASDTTLNNVYNRVVAKAMEIAKSKGGKISNLLDVRQEFDNFVKKQFPNLYSSETLTPMRQAIKDIRNELNTFTANNLPDGVGFRENLITQHQLLNAIENMAEKAVPEVGTSALSKVGRIPGLILRKAGETAIGIVR